MPLYEYYCSDCKSTFELLVSHQHADDMVCMKCHSERVRRLLSLFSSPRSSKSEAYEDMAPDMGSCGCGGDGGCGCN